jgi:AcrR family transcriptional regulator
MAREMVRQGGRSARIQEAVHRATQALLSEVGRGEINVPMIAERAGVTPSTIYRRWGDLAQLLADTAAERLRPVADPDDTGSLAGDLSAFVLQYAEEMASPVGRALLRDVLAETDSDVAAVRCCAYTTQHLQTINARTLGRGEPGFAVDEALDVLIAPIVYRILFSNGEISPDYAHRLLDRFARLNDGLTEESERSAGAHA